MKLIREWSAWVKILIGGAGFTIGMALISFHSRALAAGTGSYPRLISIGSIFFLAGFILLVWGGIQALKKNPRVLGGSVLILGLISIPVTILIVPAIWEFSQGGVVGFIPAPFLVPIIFVVPGLLIYHGFQRFRGK